MIIYIKIMSAGEKAKGFGPGRCIKNGLLQCLQQTATPVEGS